jgi:hypothetical protein
VESADLVYRISGSLLGSAQEAKRYLNKVVLVKETVHFGFKGDKRYYQKTGPGRYARLAPGVKPDYDVIPNGARRREDMKQQRRLFGTNPDEDSTETLITQKEVLVVCDGRTVCRSSDGILVSKVLLEDDKAKLPMYYAHFLDHIGMAVRAPGQKTIPGNLRDQLPLYEVLEGKKTVGAEACVLLRRKDRTDLVYLAPRLNYAVVRWDFFDDGYLQKRIENRDFNEKAAGFWVPGVERVIEYAPRRGPKAIAGKALICTTFELTSLRLNEVSDDLFVPKIKPGAAVFDSSVLSTAERKSGKFLEYKMPAGQEELDSVIKEAMSKSGFGSTRLITWVGIVLGVSLAGAVVFWAARLVKRAT